MNVDLKGRAIQSPEVQKPGKAGLAAAYLVFLAIVVRTLTSEHARAVLPQYLALEAVFLLLFTAAWWWRSSPVWRYHIYFAFQSLVVLALVSFSPEFDFAALFFLLLSYQAAVFLSGWKTWAWVGAFVALTYGSLVFYLGFMNGLARSLTTLAAQIIVAAYVLVNRETASTNAESQSLLNQLDTTNAQLKEYAEKVEDLAAVRERDRLAASLRDSVSQTLFGISFAVSSVQLLADTDPRRVPAELERIQSMAAETLSNLRSLISHLRASQ